MKKRLLLCLLCSLCLFGITGCGENKNINDENNSKLEEKMEKADILNWNQVYSTIKNDDSKVSDYNGKLYIYTGVISKIDENTKTLTLTNSFLQNGNPSTIDNVINVTLEDINGLKKEDIICVMGNLNITGNIFDIDNAVIITDKDYSDKQYNVNLIKEKGVYYFDYKYDNKINLPISYSKISFTYTTTNGNKNYIKNEEKYTLKYDDNGNLSEEKIVKYENDNEVYQIINNYEYNEDKKVSTIVKKQGAKVVTDKYTYEKNGKGQIVKEILLETQEGKKDYTKEKTYEYDDNNRIIKIVETSSLSNSTKAVTYEYNEKGQIISENERDSWLNSNHTYTYEYDSFGNKTKKLENGVTKESFVYGIVGKK